MTFIEIGWDGMYWIDLAQDRDQWRALVNMVMNLRVPYNAGKFLSSYTTGGFSRRGQLHGVSSFAYFRRFSSTFWDPSCATQPRGIPLASMSWQCFCIYRRSRDVLFQPAGMLKQKS
jgi:hypothetical protein